MTKGNLEGDENGVSEIEAQKMVLRKINNFSCSSLLSPVEHAYREEAKTVSTTISLLHSISRSSPRHTHILSFTVFMVSNFSHAMSQSKSFSLSLSLSSGCGEDYGAHESTQHKS